MLYFHMGEKDFFQPLTKHDRITVILYRTGIFISSVIVGMAASFAVMGIFKNDLLDYPLLVLGQRINIMLISLYFGVGLSVFFIHLYVGKFYRMLKRIYYAALLCLGVLFFLGGGNPAIPLFNIPHYNLLLLIPLSLCLGFVTAKEAFCFRLYEGYILAMIMPVFLFMISVGMLAKRGTVLGLLLISIMLVFFMVRKTFMPLHYDIGDKSAYQP